MKKIGCLMIFVALFVTLCFVPQFALADVYTDSDFSFSGKGTKASPYLIQNADDLKNFRDAVNNGNKFEDIYFCQTANIDLKSEEWIPIGVFGGKNYFYGIYDGGGHYIENLLISKSGNNGLFGMLGGVVMNLGIESGEIHGGCIGSFTSHAAGDKAVIINCYNKASIYGGRGGGIADNFNGIILNCWTDCEFFGKEHGDIYSYDCSRMLNCYTNNGEKNEVNADVLNDGIIMAASKAEIDMNDLYMWDFDGEKVIFSKEKYTFTISDLPQWIIAYGTWLIFGGIMAVALLIILYEFIRKNKIQDKIINAEIQENSSQ
ncbi:MAG: hypothetical protein IJZ94_04970 [Clostridia bacterium]|nr:hypothetical protein [Clostridia bacterium]